jgi:hypothetical protein
MIAIGGGVAAVLATTLTQARASREEGQNIGAFHNAKAAIDYVKYYIKASRYAANGRNEWLSNHSSDAGLTLTAGDLSELGNLDSEVTITRNGTSPWYKIESRAQVGDMADYKRVIEVWVREREPFSEYMFFVGGGITFGETTVAGRVHANGRITYNRGARNPGTNEPAKMWGETTSTGGYYFSGSGEFEEIFRIYNEDGTLKYVTDHDFDVDVRPMPDTNDIGALALVGETEGYTADDTIEFVTRQDALTGEYVTKVILDDDGLERDLPSNGVIACNTSEVVVYGRTITSGGTTYEVAGINGRVTIVNKSTSGSGQISISSPIIYIDKDGEPYYQHKDASDNYYDYRTPNYFQDSQKTTWSNNEFVRNPNYAGNSAVGIVSAEDVRYGVDLPASTSLEIDAAIVANGGFGYEHDYLVKRNLRIVGSLTFNSSYGRYSGSPVTGYGYSYSGIYQYDHKLRGNAPPHFLGTARPDFFAWRVVK